LDYCHSLRPKIPHHNQKNSLTEELLQTAHAGRIAALAFPAGCGDVFATAGPGSVRVWHASACRELLRIAVPNLDCKCLAFSADGAAILTGWSDGRVRAFGPQSGRLLWTIHDAHHKGVTALAATADPSRIVTGGEEGMVRVWRVSKSGAAAMEASMKDHKGAVNAIAVPAAGARGGSGSGACDEAVSASSDGSVVVWDLAAHRCAQQGVGWGGGGGGACFFCVVLV
jgi:WD40 repeat protein